MLTLLLFLSHLQIKGQNPQLTGTIPTQIGELTQLTDNSALDICPDTCPYLCVGLPVDVESCLA
jgi:hypothetical protein